MLDKLLSIEKSIDSIEKGINEGSLSEPQRMAAFLDYKEYLEKADKKMQEARLAEDPLIAKKSEQIGEKIQKVMALGTSFMAVNAPEKSVLDSLQDDTKPVEPDEAKRNLTVSGKNPQEDADDYFIFGRDGNIRHFVGDLDALSSFVNRELAADISRGFVPQVFRGDRMASETSVFYRFKTPAGENV